MLKTIKILFVAAVMAMLFTASAHAFLGFGDSDEWKQTDMLAKKTLAPIASIYKLVRLKFEDFDRVEEKEISVADGLWTIYVATYDITLTSGDHAPVRVVMYYMGATESKLIDGESTTSDVFHVEYSYTSAAKDEVDYSDSDLDDDLEQYNSWITEERGFSEVIAGLAKHKYN